jgi:excisionase family DNA binding protein
MKSHRLLDGTIVALADLTASEKNFLKTLRKMARGGSSYFDIYRFALGPGSPALQGRNRVDKALVETSLYRLAEDVAARVGIDQGLILAPEHEAKRVLAREIEEPLSVPQAAEIIGVTRVAAYKAIQEGRLAHVRIGNVLLVRRADAEEYKRLRESGRRGDAGKSVKKTASVR